MTSQNMGITLTNIQMCFKNMETPSQNIKKLFTNNTKP
jgi:hypothetical protein